MLFDQVYKQYEIVRYLLFFFYVFFVQVIVYGQVCDKMLFVVIEGSVDEVKVFFKFLEDF